MQSRFSKCFVDLSAGQWIADIRGDVWNSAPTYVYCLATQNHRVHNYSEDLSDRASRRSCVFGCRFSSSSHLIQELFRVLYPYHAYLCCDVVTCSIYGVKQHHGGNKFHTVIIRRNFDTCRNFCASEQWHHFHTRRPKYPFDHCIFSYSTFLLLTSGINIYTCKCAQFIHHSVRRQLGTMRWHINKKRPYQTPRYVLGCERHLGIRLVL